MPALVTSMYQNGYGKSQDKPDVTISTTSGQDAFVLRYTTDGVALWSARIGGSGSEQAWAVTTDSDNNVIVCGQTGSVTATFLYNSDGTYSGKFIPAGGLTAVFIAKYHSSGKALWIARLDGTTADIGYSVSVDSNGNIFAAGQQGASVLTAFNVDGTAFGTTLPSRGSGDAFIVEYNSDGVVQWLAQIGSTAADIANGVEVDSTGNVYVVGQCGATSVNTIAYNADGTTGATITSSGGAEMFLVKYSGLGVVQWSARVSTTGAEIGQSLVIDSSDNVYIYGRTATTTTVAATAFNSDGTPFGTTPTGSGTVANDPCVVKYDSSGFVQWIVVTGGGQSDAIHAMTIDPSDNIYISYQRGGSGNGETNIHKYDSNGTLLYSGAAVNSDGGDTAWGLTTDSSGNLYLGVSCASLGSSIRVNNIGVSQVASYPFLGGTDSLLIKYNSTGIVQWIRRIGNANSDNLYGLTYGTMNDLYQVGVATSTSLPVYGQQLSLFSTIANSGGTDGFVVKYNTNGATQWVARIASTGDDIVYGTATDSSGNVYVTGQSGSEATTTFFNADTSAFPTTLASAGARDLFIGKYSTDGVVQWVASVTSTGADIGYAAATDLSGNVYITGFGGSGVTVTANNSDGTPFSPALANGGSNDSFVIKYDSSGFVQWNARIESTGADLGYGIATDSSGNVYVTGETGSGVTTRIRNADDTIFGSLATLGSTDIFVAKYNPSGNVQWIARIGAAGADSGRSISVDTSGNVYIGGQSGASGATGYQGGDGTGASFGSVANIGGTDAFLVKYDTDGVGQWITRIGSTLNDTGISGVTTDAFGNVYVVGNAGASTVTAFSVGNIAFSPTLVSVGLGDVFIVKYNTAGRVQWITRIASVVAESAWGVKADRSGNIYVVGQFGPGVASLTVFNSDTSAFLTMFESCAVVKYDTNGIGQWVQVLRGTTTGVNARSVDVDIFNNIYVGGHTISGQPMTIYSSDYKPYKILQSQRGTQEGYLIKYSNLGVPQWVSVISTAGADALYEVATDSSGNSYATGQYGTGTMFLYNGDGTLFTPTLAISGTLDSIVLKYNSSGIIQWRSRITGGGSEQALAIKTDSSANVYVTGQGGSGTTTIFIDSDDVTRLANLATTAGLQDAFVVKYDSSGFGQWRFRISSTAVDSGISVATDSSGNVYVTGRAGAATFFNADDVSSGTTITDTGSTDAFVTKYDTNGIFQWVAKLGSNSTNADSGFGIAVDSSGNVYVTGQQGGSTLTVTNADGSSGGSITSLTATNQDVFIIKFNSSGIAQWLTRIASANSVSGGNEIGRSIALDSSANVYVVGQFFGNASANIYAADGTTVFTTMSSSGNQDAFIVKYDTNGNPQWVSRIGSITSANTEQAYAVATDTAGNVYVSGVGNASTPIQVYNGSATGSGITIFGSVISTGGGGGNMFLVKYNSSGQVQWITSFSGGSGEDVSRGLAIDTSGNIYMSGIFTESVFVPESS